jgi:hypothetical protein
MLNLNEFAKDVHAVAVEHGWWEGEENNDIDTKIALIHAEWSEALEEYRAGRPMVWRECGEAENDEELVCVENACIAWANGDCDICSRDNKPEGIAVELVDGVIRILDLMAAKDMDFAQTGYICGGKRTLPQLVAILHYATAESAESESEAASRLISCIEAVREWLEEQGVDMDEILRLKHEYNKTRSYRHGGKRC